MKSRLAWVGLVLVSLCVARGAASAPVIVHVAPDGKDQWSGRLPSVNADSSDGPLASPLGARNAVRKLRAAGEKGPVTVSFRGGAYWMAEPLVLEPQDSGTTDGKTVYAALGDERPVLSGGRPIGGWKAQPGGLWSATIPEAAAGKWAFQQLWVNGQRRIRARTPNEGYFRMVQKGSPTKDAAGKLVPQDRTSFVFAGSDIKPWPDLKEAQVVVFHSWETSRLRIAGVDQAQRLVKFTGPSCWPFENWEKEQRYYVENVRDGLDAPGEWHLDRSTGTLDYRPMPGEDMTKAEVIAPRLTSLVEFRGRPDEKQFVEQVVLRGLTFSHEDWILEPQGHSDPQAVVTAPAAVMADGARRCAIEKCEVSHVGDYGVWLRRGCHQCRIAQNRICDLGVGGVRIGEAKMPAADHVESSHNAVDNNHIFDGGHVYPAGVGVWVAQSSHNMISHNEIHDFFYSGMSIGWNWDDAPNRCHHNTIEQNHVHHVMRGMLSDGGAIYTLGTSPGSVIRNNVFHDVWSFGNPPYGWGVYLDATCSGYLVENNVVYNIHSGCLMYSNGGHEHVIRNNIFAFPANHMLWPFWEKRPNTFQRNLMLMSQGTQFVPFTERTLRERIAAKDPLGSWDANLYWHTGEKEQLKFFKHSFAEWQALGLDRNSLLANPQFVNAEEYDFRLQPGSPALKLGFQPIDTARVGLYGDPAWVEEARRVKHPKTVFPPPPSPPPPLEVSEDFEKYEPGAAPDNAVVSGEDKGASIRVTDQQAASGKRSLKITDAKGLEPSWQPHFFYQPRIAEGTVRQSFDLKLQPGSLMFTEWRDEAEYPACIGPSVTFDGAGRVTAGGKVLATVPTEGWIHVEIQAPLGKDAPRRYTLTVTPSGGAAKVFPDLPVPGKAFRELHWLGFVSTATVETAFYLDNIRIQRIDRPNIVLVLADDLGYGDVRCNNPQGKIATPHIDRLAAAGIRFTDAHTTSSVCTPTRYSLLTGRYHWRTRLQSGVLGGLSPPLVAPERLTVAELLRRQGYHTACIGKWHLGMEWPRKPDAPAFDDRIEKGPEGWNVDFTRPIALGPNTVGFDYYFGISASLDMVPYTFIENDRVTALPTVDKAFPMMLGKDGRGTRPGPGAEKFEAADVLPMLTRSAVEYISRRGADARAGKPFFLYLPLNAPHTPIAPTAEWQGRSGLNPYADFVVQTDDCIGQVARALDEHGLAGNTLLIVTSDNGCSPEADFPALLAKGHNPSHVLRGHKADIFDGGHRVPLVVRWPGKVRPGSTSDELVSLVDFTATAAEITGAKLPDNAAEDSVSLLPALLGETGKPLREALVHQSVEGKFAIRQGQWKLVLCPGSGGWSGPRDPEAIKRGLPRVQLYDMSSDIGEQRNLQAEHPEVVKRLTALLEKYVAEGRSTPGAPQRNDVPVDLWKER